MKKIFLFSCIILLFSQCVFNLEGKWHSIDFYNKSGKPICYLLSLNYFLFYPDTVLPQLPQKFPDLYKINDELHNVIMGYTEDEIYSLLPADTLSIFFFDPDTLAKYDWETIRKDYKILIRYDLSRQDLKKLDWCFYYPPTEEMKGMKMFPPYKK